MILPSISASCCLDRDKTPNACLKGHQLARSKSPEALVAASRERRCFGTSNCAFVDDTMAVSYSLNANC